MDPSEGSIPTAETVQNNDLVLIQTENQQLRVFEFLPPSRSLQAIDSFEQQKAASRYNQMNPRSTYSLSTAPQPNWKLSQRHEYNNKNYAKKGKRVYCFNSEAPVHMFNGETRNIKDLKIGDILLSTNSNPTIIKKIKRTEYFCMQDMVEFDDFLITKGHPIFINNDWYRPDELFQTKSYFIEILYNVYCEPFHEIFVGIKNKIFCSSLGGTYPRIAKLDPYTDIIYGSGYKTENAKRYKWLLTIAKRIPNEKVEEETEKYWARQKAIEV